jgi:parvulin-like peptidyl-prolyl isomerase
MRLQRTLQDLAGPVPKPTAEDVERFCSANRQHSRKPERVHAAHIVRHVDETHSEAEARAGIEAALAELERGQPFAEVADRYSDCQGHGGDLGAFARGIMIEEFDQVVFARKPGQRSPILRTAFGFHIAEVYAINPGGAMDITALKPLIEGHLMNVRRRQAMRQAIERLRARPTIRRISRRETEDFAAHRAARS